jgi:hypothetical protein
LVSYQVKGPWSTDADHCGWSKERKNKVDLRLIGGRQTASVSFTFLSFGD